MLSASFASLLLPGIEAASAPEYRALSVGGVELVGVLPVLVGFALGGVLLDRSDQWVPHVHVVVTGRGGRRAGEARANRAGDDGGESSRANDDEPRADANAARPRVEEDTTTGREVLDVVLA